MDKNLWKPENYLDFLTARRQLLAEAANQFLDTLLKGMIPEAKPAVSILEKASPVITELEEEEKLLVDLNQWVVGQGLPGGFLNYQMPDSAGQEVEILDLAWSGYLLTSIAIYLLLPEWSKQASKNLALRSI